MRVRLEEMEAKEEELVKAKTAQATGEKLITEIAEDTEI